MMNLSHRPARAKDFENYYHTFFPHDRHDSALRSLIKREWDVLMDAPATLSLAIEEANSPRPRMWGFIQCVFVTERFAQLAHEGMAPWMCAHIANGLPDGSRALLEQNEVRDANAGAGLTGLVTRWHMDSDCLNAHDTAYLRHYLHLKFSFFWRGYNLKEILVEATGPKARDQAIGFGFELLQDNERFYQNREKPIPRAWPYLMHLTREQMLVRDEWVINGAMVYQPPCHHFGFSAREQEMLRWALSGASDCELASTLDLTIWTIRKRWQSIYMRVEQQKPALWDAPESGECAPSARSRGMEKRSVLLRHLDEHPEDLYG